ncbi:hypothetical protein [Streptomyces poriferorum]|uniref:Uncharacterized protein n=1 Tax=Streptomyces poriferorum TaxID=2798799 RepID=A0ABY9J580_9ACTN|nr:MULTISPECIES: hypothetical protein [unclassified Streptomyces]MDP5317413.1 hypothetical protein [Streptomyces sp. Alt4]WLQ62019.1 hypothetical protein P8A19_41840 [Streptomyces sp. Alt2]
MNQSRGLGGTVYEGLPLVDAVPTGMPTPDGVIAALILVVKPGVDPAEVDDFVTRYRLVPRGQTARAVDSQARWTLEKDGRVTIQLLCEDSAARIVIPSDPRIHQWTALARHGGGSLSLIVAPGLPDTDLKTIGYHLGPYGGPYWHISVGFIPA